MDYPIPRFPAPTPLPKFLINSPTSSLHSPPAVRVARRNEVIASGDWVGEGGLGVSGEFSHGQNFKIWKLSVKRSHSHRTLHVLSLSELCCRVSDQWLSKWAGVKLTSGIGYSCVPQNRKCTRRAFCLVWGLQHSVEDIVLKTSPETFSSIFKLFLDLRRYLQWKSKLVLFVYFYHASVSSEWFSCSMKLKTKTPLNWQRWAWTSLRMWPNTLKKHAELTEGAIDRYVQKPQSKGHSEFFSVALSVNDCCLCAPSDFCTPTCGLSRKGFWRPLF